MTPTIKRIVNRLLWFVIGLYGVFITAVFLFFVSVIFYSQDGHRNIPNWFTLKPWGEKRVNHCAMNLTVYRSEDLNTIFFENKEVLDTIKEIGGENTGFEITLDSWDNYWGCLTGKTVVTVVDFDEAKRTEIIKYIDSQNLPFVIRIPMSNLSN